MTSLRFPEITDELLSAYIDQAVTEEEKTLVETAVADEPAIAWRLETLRQTVTLLRTMPAVALPRSFVLSEAQLAAIVEDAERAGRGVHWPAISGRSRWVGFWMAWRAFWAVGSPLLRNAAAASFVVFLFLLAGDLFVSQSQRVAAPGAASRPVTSIAVVATAAPLPTVAPTPVNPATATPVTVAAEQAAPAAEAPDAQALKAAEAATVPATPGAAPEMARPTTQTSPTMRAMHPPGPDEGVAFAPEAAGSAVFSDERESGPAIASVPPVPSAGAEQEMAASAAGGAPEAAVGQAVTGSAPVSPTASSQATSVVTTTVVTTTTVPSAPSSQEGAAIPTSLPPQSRTPLVATDARSSPAAPAVALPLIEIFQISLACLTVIFSLLWWRSRSTNSKSV